MPVTILLPLSMGYNADIRPHAYVGHIKEEIT